MQQDIRQVGQKADGGENVEPAAAAATGDADVRVAAAADVGASSVEAPAVDAVEGDGDGAGDVVTPHFDDFVAVAEICRAQRFRDYILMSGVADRFGPVAGGASADALLRVGDAYSALGVLNAPLFESLARAHLAAWGSPRSTQRMGQAGAVAPSVGDLTRVARSFSAQRMRHEELFASMASLLQGRVAEANAKQALSLLHSAAFLRLGSDSFGGGLWESLEQQATSGGEIGALGTGPLAELCYVLVLARRSEARPEDMARLLEALAGRSLELEDKDFDTAEGSLLHSRMLLLRSVMRYLYRDQYRALAGDVIKAFRRVHRMERPPTALKPAVSFTRKMSKMLTKLKIGHVVNVESGPFVFDIAERGRKLVYECNHFDRYYVGTTEKIATMALQERVVKAMGYRVVQVPHWHWKKIHHRRQRTEYLRMSRYYAMKDRRELAPRDEVPTDVAMNEFDYMGEYFFRKDRPSSPWSWFQPRYDYTMRLPPESPSSPPSASKRAAAT